MPHLWYTSKLAIKTTDWVKNSNIFDNNSNSHDQPSCSKAGNKANYCKVGYVKNVCYIGLLICILLALYSIMAFNL